MTKTRRHLLPGFLGIWLILGLSTGAFAQVDMSQPEMSYGPAFFVDAMSYRSDTEGLSRIEVYVQIPYAELSFVKEGEQYDARYEMVVGVYDENDSPVIERSWMDEIQVSDFGQTTSPQMYRLVQRSLDVKPGNYSLSVRIRDEESGRSSKAKNALLVTDFNEKSLSMSDIMLVKRLSTEGDRRTIVPNISGRVPGSGEGFFLYFEIYQSGTLDSVRLRWRILDKNGNEVFQHARTELLTSTRTQTFIKIADVPLRASSYLAVIEAWPPDSALDADRKAMAFTSRRLVVRDPNLPPTITDIDKAIEQMIYVARSSDVDHIREAEDPDTRLERFLEYWKKRDPDPETKQNELMNEYYARVEYANKAFGSFREGWKSDMGMVFIRFGHPENVERHPFETGTKPYEIWYYYQLNRKFIFSDVTGFGDYRLEYPTTDLWGRIRDL